jgi:hypothetical protein
MMASVLGSNEKLDIYFLFLYSACIQPKKKLIQTVYQGLGWLNGNTSGSRVRGDKLCGKAASLFDSSCRICPSEGTIKR